MRTLAGRLAGGWGAPPPLAHTRGTLRRLLWESGLPFGDLVDGLLAVEVAPEDLRRLSALLLDGLSEAELGDYRAVLVEKGSAFDLGVLPRMQEKTRGSAQPSRRSRVVRGRYVDSGREPG